MTQERGLPRLPYQTPTEYAHNLSLALLESQEALETITAGYIQALRLQTAYAGTG